MIEYPRDDIYFVKVEGTIHSYATNGTVAYHVRDGKELLEMSGGKDWRVAKEVSWNDFDKLNLALTREAFEKELDAGGEEDPLEPHLTAIEAEVSAIRSKAVSGAGAEVRALQEKVTALQKKLDACEAQTPEGERQIILAPEVLIKVERIFDPSRFVNAEDYGIAKGDSDDAGRWYDVISRNVNKRILFDGDSIVRNTIRVNQTGIAGIQGVSPETSRIINVGVYGGGEFGAAVLDLGRMSNTNSHKVYFEDFSILVKEGSWSVGGMRLHAVRDLVMNNVETSGGKFGFDFERLITGHLQQLKAGSLRKDEKGLAGFIFRNQANGVKMILPRVVGARMGILGMYVNSMLIEAPYIESTLDHAMTFGRDIEGHGHAISKGIVVKAISAENIGRIRSIIGHPGTTGEAPYVFGNSYLTEPIIMEGSFNGCTNVEFGGFVEVEDQVEVIAEIRSGYGNWNGNV